jgi:hypothetical protein
MATNLITNYFRLHNVKQFRESISETANTAYYVFVGQSTPYEAGDETPPDQLNTTAATFNDPFRVMVFGKRVANTDTAAATKKFIWTANTVYTPYRGDVDLTGEPYYVATQASVGADYDVFKCLDNNGGNPSTDPPSLASTSPDDDYYQNLEDLYVWKYMYTVPISSWNRFATDEYMPVISDADVVGNAVSGAIDLIVVDSGGSHYNTYLSNTFVSADLRVGGNTVLYNISTAANPDNDYYTGSFLYVTGGDGNGQGRRIVDYFVVGATKTVEIDYPFSSDNQPTAGSTYEITPGVLITGDGSNAVARAVVDTGLSNTVTRIEILEKGSSYTYGSAVVTGNTGGVSNAAVLTVVLGPKGGHGSDPEFELGATSVVVSVTLANNEGNNVPTENDYRQIGIIKDPLFNRVELTIGTPTGVFVVGETVTQATSGATGTVLNYDGLTTIELTNVNGVFVADEVVTGAGGSASVTSFTINQEAKNFNTFDQRFRYTYSSQSGNFIEDEVVYQTDTLIANAVFHSINDDFIYFTDVRGTLNTANTVIGQESEATANLLFAFPPDIVPGSGEVLYIENKTPIARSNSQSETIKIILQF